MYPHTFVHRHYRHINLLTIYCLVEGILPLYCLSFFKLRLLIIPLVYSNFSSWICFVFVFIELSFRWWVTSLLPIFESYFHFVCFCKNEIPILNITIYFIYITFPFSGGSPFPNVLVTNNNKLSCLSSSKMYLSILNTLCKENYQCY